MKDNPDAVVIPYVKSIDQLAYIMTHGVVGRSFTFYYPSWVCDIYAPS